MEIVLLCVVAVLIVAAFLGLWLWTRRVEQDEIDWDHGHHSDDKQKAVTEIAVGINVNGTYSR